MKQIILLLALLNISCPVTCAQKANTLPLGWDLSYSSVLDANGVGREEWLRKWLGPKYQSPATAWISGWSQGPIKSSALLEFPAAHAGERIILWFVRTENRADYYERAEGNPLFKDDKPPHEMREALDLQAYDKFFSAVSTWQQNKRVQPQDTPTSGVPGYSGFLSLYDSGNSRQMLLTIEDYAICDTKKCDSWKPGRLMEALQLIPRFKVDAIRHKSEAEIAAMTPAGRVEEYANEQGHKYDVRDEQSTLIEKYVWRDGLKAIPRMIEIMNEYDPGTASGRSVKKGPRFNAMWMLLSDLDTRVVRLRASSEGRQAMDALERAISRMHAAAEHGGVEMAKTELESAKGINYADEAIRDTLWVKYRIKMSDRVLLALSNFLVARDPTYPSWSEMDFIKDYSRINKAGYPAQVYIMKNPERFYRAYLEFKKTKR